MKLTEEQHKAIEWASEHAANYARPIDGETTMMRYSRVLRELLAAHNAEAQGEPYGWIGFDNANGLNAAFYFGPAKPESCTYYFPLYAEPKPTPQTDAALDANRVYENLDDVAITYVSREAVQAVLNAIERIDCAKGE